jgi:hypothetical protein
MTFRTPREIWTEQCDAARDVKTRYGSQAAFDYVVAEKLMTFAAAAAKHTEFARELPRFVSEVRRLFTPEELRQEIERIGGEPTESHAMLPEDDEVFAAESAQEQQRFAIITELLTAPKLGTA